MKTTHLISQAIAGVSALLAAAFAIPSTATAAPSISFFGYQIDTPAWRSTDVPKVISLASNQGSVNDADGYYGTDGWLLPNLANNLYLPSYAPLEGITAPGTSVFASASYAQDIDDPTQPISGTVADLPEGYWTIAYQIPGEGEEANLYNFTLSGTVPSSFLIGVAFGNLDTPGEDPYATASFSASVGASSTGQLTAIANNKQIDWIFFRVDNAQAGDTVSIFGTGGTNGLASVAAISFDPVPELPVLANVWDLENDFSTTTNPNGAWSYGYGVWGGTSFTALPQADDIFALTGLNGWSLISDPYQLPVIAKNTTASDIDVFGSIVPPGSVLAYPGFSSSLADIAIVRWTAPESGVYNISSRWTRLDPAPNISQANIFKNLGGVDQLTLFGSFTTFANPSIYQGTGIELQAGDTLDFMVYSTGDVFPGDGPGTDGVGLDITISGEPISTQDLPTLTITRVGGDVRLAWPSWATTSTLESSTTLEIGSFAPAGLTVVTEGEEFAAYEALIPAGKKFYRLATP